MNVLQSFLFVGRFWGGCVVSDLGESKTKINKTERVEFRCTKAFKKSMEEIARQNNTTVSKVAESICADKIKEYFSSVVQIVNPVSDKEGGKTNAPSKSTDQAERDEVIWEMMQQGETPTRTAEWLNKNGYKPARGKSFTLSSVHSIRKRLKKERG
jgi:hypothetical protein